MKVEFSDRDLKICAENESFAVRTMGKDRELTGNRKGQWACSLDQPNRLITKGAEPNETVVWSNVSVATVLEIVDYH